MEDGFKMMDESTGLEVRWGTNCPILMKRGTKAGGE